MDLFRLCLGVPITNQNLVINQTSIDTFMEEIFSEKAAKCIVIDSSGAVRHLMSDVIKGAGFTSVNGAANIKDVLGMLEVERYDWILCPLFEDQEVNALNLLQIISENHELNKTRVTLLLEEEEEYCLTAAYELGLMNWFTKPFNKDSLEKAIGEFLEQLESLEWNTTKYAAERFNAYLEKNEKTNIRLDLYKGLINLYPGDPDVLLKLAEPQFLSGDENIAKRTLEQVIMLNPDKKDQVEEIKSRLFEEFEEIEEEGDEEDKESDAVPINVLGVETIVIVDSDEANNNALKEILESVGVPSVQCFEDGESAWEWLKENEEPDLLIHEWKLPKLSGPLFIQRVRSRFATLQFVCQSSLINQSDWPLVQEMGVAGIVSKPIDRQKFLKVVVYTIQQDKLPTKIETLEQKIRLLIRADKMKEAMELRSNYLSIESIPQRRKNKIEAEFAYAEGDYIKARDLAASALRENRDSIVLLNLLSKALMKLRDFNAALRCLEKAQSLSPLNVKRLCEISEVHSDMGNDAAAKEALDQAKETDSGSEDVKESEAKLAISQGNTKDAQAMLGQLESLPSFISYMNNKAVANARCGMFDEGIDLYNKVIDSIPENERELRIVVTYNLGLAFTRMGEYEKATQKMNNIIDFGESKVLKKAKSLKKRLSKAMKEGSKVKLFSDPKDDSKPQEQIKKSEEMGAAEGGNSAADSSHKMQTQHKSLVSQVNTNAGDICLYLIFNSNEAPDEKVKIMLSHKPNFNFRQAIERDESFGAEKIKKAG